MNLNKEIHIKKIKWPRSLSFYLPLIVSRILYVPALAVLIVAVVLIGYSIYGLVIATNTNMAEIFLAGIAFLVVSAFVLMIGSTLMFGSIYIQILLKRHNQGFSPKRGNIVYGIPLTGIAICLAVYVIFSFKYAY